MHESGPLKVSHLGCRMEHDGSYGEAKSCSRAQFPCEATPTCGNSPEPARLHPKLQDEWEGFSESNFQAMHS